MHPQVQDPILHKTLEAANSYRTGDLATAERLCREILRSAPQAFDASHLLGLVRLGAGDAAEAVKILQRAAGLNPQNPEVQNSLACALRATGDHEGACAAYRKAIAGKAVYLDAFHNLALTLTELDRTEEALQTYQKALLVAPGNPVTLRKLGSLWLTCGNPARAEVCWQEALAAQPGDALLLNDLGNAIRAQSRLAEAVDYFRRALTVRPDFVVARLNCASALQEIGDYAGAATHYQTILDAAPQHALDIDIIRAHPDALGASYAKAAYNLSLMRLAQGDLAVGWRYYGLRPSLLHPQATTPPASLDGDLHGKRVLLVRDQGLGDELFFLRFAALLKQRGAWVACRPDPRLAPLLARATSIDQVVGVDETLADIAATIPVGDLPRLLEIDDPAKIPPPLALPPEPARRQRMAAMLAELGPAPYIGVTWRAGIAPGAVTQSFTTPFKQVPLEGLARALCGVSGTIVVLQRHPARGEIDTLARLLNRPVYDLSTCNDDLEDMLALQDLLDEYVGVSNTNMHLRATAGKIGRILIPYPPEWRWLTNAERSPWYRDFPLYREDARHGWEGALERLGTDLRNIGGGAENADVDALLTRGNACFQRGDLIEARRHYAAILAIGPHAVAFNNLGILASKEGKADEAITCLRRAIAENATYADAFANLGRLLNRPGELDEAERCCRRAMELKPAAAHAYINLSAILLGKGDAKNAEVVARQAVARAPQEPLAWNNLGAAQKSQGRYAEAAETFRRCLAIAPNDKDAPYNLAFVELALGDFANAWPHYFYRPRFIKVRETLSPIVPNADLRHKRLLLVKSQGIGDELFFLRFAPELKARGAWLAYRPDPKIASILAHLDCIDRILEPDETLADADHVFAVDDLPLLVNMDSVAKMPAPLALNPQPHLVEKIRERLAALGPPPYLGLTWRAGKNDSIAGKYHFLGKEISMRFLAETIAPTEATVLVLQRNPQPGEIEQLGVLLGRPAHDLSDLNEDLEQMLALLAVIDDYIGVSNTNMHLMAGLGKPTRVLIPYPPEWRWMADGDASPWYPHAKVYRQGAMGDWDTALAQLRTDLESVSCTSSPKP